MLVMLVMLPLPPYLPEDSFSVIDDQSIVHLSQSAADADDNDR